MASAPAWQPAQDARSSLLAALKAAQSSQRKYPSAQEIFVLPVDARLTSSSDFARATKSGTRVTSQHFVGYLYLSPATNPTENKSSAKCGLIISKSVGRSVKRHRVARKVRHAVAPKISSLPTGSRLVIRALTQNGDSDISLEISELVTKLITRSEKFAAK
jgi:ribonuclease P protein component